MTPELRAAIFSFPLCLDSIGEPSSWLPAGGKREVLYALQELFVKLAYIDEKAISTANLTASFGWTGEEVIVQHDVQELSRVFFDSLDRALSETEFSDLIGKYCKGKFLNVTICSKCSAESEREEVFADIGLRVKGCSNIVDSLDQLTKEDMLDGNNQYFCEVCGVKVDALRFTRIKTVPPLLTFALNRFEYDMQTYERVKITQNFEFPLEVDMSKYVENAGIYELFAVIIHGGSAHSGHYHAYIRDILKQGKWNPSAQPSPPSPKAEPVVKPQGKTSKKSKKNKRKSKNRTLNQNKQNSNNNNKKESEPENIAYQYEDFPGAYEKSELLQNWFDFNDSTVTAIKSGKLKKQFGGSNETAYILIYRSRNSMEISAPEMPAYWKSAIASLNEDHRQHREKYEECKKYIEVQLQEDFLLDFEEGVATYKDKEKSIIHQGRPLKMNLENTIEDLKNQITCEYIDDIPDIFETHQFFFALPLSNKCAHIQKPLDSIENHLTLKEARINHKACLLILPRNQDHIERVLDFIGEECEPLSITCTFDGDKFPILANKAWTLMRLKERIFEKLGIPLPKIELKIRKFEGGERKLRSKDEDLSLNELKFYNSIPLIISTNEEEIQMVELAKNDQGEGLTSVLLNDENTADKPIQHLINSQWKVRDLMEECRKLFDIPAEVPVRLRKLIDRKVVVKEDLDLSLLTGDIDFRWKEGSHPHMDI